VMPSLSTINFHGSPATEIAAKTINIKMMIMRSTVLLISIGFWGRVLSLKGPEALIKPDVFG
jgi:hypothetical protein